MRTFIFTILVAFVLSGSAQDLNYTPHDSIFFEHNTVPVYMDPSPVNIWQIGTPQKSWLNNAYSPPLAIITDTVNPYPAGNTSSFSFVIDSGQIFPLSGRLATYFSFIHRYETDTINDYGTVEASIDGGITWCNLSDDNCFMGSVPVLVWWESDSSITSHRVFPHTERISGKSDGWIFSRIHFDYAVGKGQESTVPIDSIIIRFTFKSSSSSSGNEGWIIDNIITGVCDIYVSAPSLEKEDFAVTVSPNPVVDRSVIILPGKRSGPVEILIYDVTGKMVRKISGNQGTRIPISRDDFLPGIYLLKSCLNGEKPNYAKFIIQ